MTHKQVARYLKVHAEKIEQIANTFGDEDLKASVDAAFAELTRALGVVQAYDLEELMARAPKV